VDYGRKRIGLAVSDELNLIAKPLATLTRTNRQNDLRRLREICRKNGVNRVIVGHPIHLEGHAGEMAVEAEKFAARVRKELGVAVELVDERLTSWEAEQLIGASGRKGIVVDEIAAAVLLQDYLSQIDRATAKKRATVRR